MSRTNTIRLIIWKELLDMGRDRRTIITTLVIPLLAFPILFGVVGYLGNPTANPSPVLVVNLDASNGNYSSLVTNGLIHANGLSVSASNDANATAAVQSGKYDIAIVIPADFSSSIAAGGRVNMTIYYNPANGRALQGISIIEGVVTSVSQQITAQRLADKGVTTSDLNPIGLNANAVGKAQTASTILIADLFPSFLLYFTFLGAFYFMVDDIAGEKERRSLEALFTLAPSRTTIFVGKYAVAFLLAMVTTVLGLVGTLVGLDALGSGSGASAASLPPEFYPEVFAIVALAALCMCALGFCISTFSKNVREAQQYLSPIFFVFFIPLYFTFSLPPNELSQFAAFPLIGFSLLIRDLILGSLTVTELVISVVVNLVFLVLMVWLGLKLLRSEKVILRTG
jgi:sodium transport system permease protein